MSERYTSEYAGRVFRHRKTGGLYALACLTKLEDPVIQQALAGQFERVAAVTHEASGRQLELYRARTDAGMLLIDPARGEDMGEAFVVYRSQQDQRWWARREEVFFDGRFDPLATDAAG